MPTATSDKHDAVEDRQVERDPAGRLADALDDAEAEGENRDDRGQHDHDPADAGEDARARRRRDKLR